MRGTKRKQRLCKWERQSANQVSEVQFSHQSDKQTHAVAQTAHFKGNIWRISECRPAEQICCLNYGEQRAAADGPIVVVAGALFESKL